MEQVRGRCAEGEGKIVGQVRGRCGGRCEGNMRGQVRGTCGEDCGGGAGGSGEMDSRTVGEMDPCCRGDGLPDADAGEMDPRRRDESIF